MDEGIQVSIGIIDEEGFGPIQFDLHDEGVAFWGNYTKTDLTACVAILRDLADAIELKIKMVTN